MWIEDEASSYVVDEGHCRDEIIDMFNDLLHEANAQGRSVTGLVGPAAANVAFDKVQQDIFEWCRKEAVL